MSTNTAAVNMKNSAAMEMECIECIERLADILTYTNCELKNKAEEISYCEERLFIAGYLKNDDVEEQSAQKRRREKIYAEIFTEWVFNMYVAGLKSRRYLEGVFLNQVIDTMYISCCMEHQEINMGRVFSNIEKNTAARLFPYCVKINWSFHNFADIPFINRDVIGNSTRYAEFDRIIMDNFERFLVNAGEKVNPEKDIATLLYTFESADIDFWRNKLFNYIEKENFENIPTDSKVFRECLPKLLPELIPHICHGYLKMALNGVGELEEVLQMMVDYKKYYEFSFLTADDVQAIISFVVGKRDGNLLNKVMKFFKEDFGTEIASVASAYLKDIVADIVNSAAEDGNEDALYPLSNNRDFFDMLLKANNMMMVPYGQLKMDL